MKFKFTPTELPGVIVVEHERAGDDRGFFAETFRKKEFAEGGIKVQFVQENHSRSAKHVLRGLHFQKAPEAIAKLVRCAQGEIFDVAVDMRPESPTYRKWVGARLSDHNQQMLFIPEGFAHGFLVLSDSADVIYKQTGYYSQEHEAGIRWDDPAIGIQWPDTKPLLSPRDEKLPLLSEGVRS